VKTGAPPGRDWTVVLRRQATRLVEGLWGAKTVPLALTWPSTLAACRAAGGAGPALAGIRLLL
jgi:hypothetical protein